MLWDVKLLQTLLKDFLIKLKELILPGDLATFLE